MDNGTISLGNGINSLGNGIILLGNGINSLGNGIILLGNGTVQLDNGTILLDNGTIPLGNGTAQLDNGTVQLDNGTVQLDNGTVQLDNGTVPLGNGIISLGNGVVPLGNGSVASKIFLATTGRRPPSWAKFHPGIPFMIKSYYPTSIDNRAGWWANIAGAADSVFLGLGFSSAELGAIQADAAMAVFLYRTLPDTYEEFGKRVTGYIQTYLNDPEGSPAPAAPPVPAWPATQPPAVLAGIEKRREKWVQRCKDAASYDAGVQGAVLRIEPTGTPFDPATYAAEILDAASPGPGLGTCKFRKARGNIEGMAVYGRKAGTSAWKGLGRFTVSPASFTIALQNPGTPEEWELQGRALLKDREVGVPSAILQVLVRG